MLTRGCVAGKVAARCIQRFGLRGYTTLSNVACAAGYACWAIPKPLPMWLGLLIIMPVRPNATLSCPADSCHALPAC